MTWQTHVVNATPLPKLGSVKEVGPFVKSGTASGDIAVCPAGILYKASVRVMGATVALKASVSEVRRRPSTGPDTMVCPLQNVPKRELLS